MEFQVEPELFFTDYYNSKDRLISYWNQVKEIMNLNPKKVLEIGIGNRFTSQYLKNSNINVLTLDIDKRLNPDICGSILDIPFSNESFDVVASFEVLEHLPYEDAKKALIEIHRISQKYVILSLPDATKVYRFCFFIPYKGLYNKLIPIPQKPTKHVFNGMHYWEIGKINYSLDKIINDIKLTGFKVERTYRLIENPYHRFFILSKIN